MFKNTSVRTLIRYAMVGFGTLPIIGYSLRFKVQSQVRNTTSYQKAVKIIQSEETPRKILGEPIEVGDLDVGNSTFHGYVENIRWLAVPIKGPLTNGYLKYWFLNHDGVHTVVKVELLDTSFTKTVYSKVTV